MVINPYFDFVFIHIPKCAGTSLRTAFSNARSDDISSDIKQKKKILKSGSKKTKHETYLEFTSAFTLRTGLPVSTIDNYKVIAFTRHPYARFCSLHSFLREKHSETYPDVPRDVNDFAHQFFDGSEAYLQKIRSLKSQISFIEGIPDDRLILGKYENLIEDYESIVRKIGILRPGQIQHLNKSSDTLISINSLTSKSKEILQDKFCLDFKYFSYEV